MPRLVVVTQGGACLIIKIKSNEIVCDRLVNETQGMQVIQVFNIPYR